MRETAHEPARHGNVTCVSALLYSTAVVTALSIGSMTATAAPTQSVQKLPSVTTEVPDAADPILTE